MFALLALVMLGLGVAAVVAVAAFVLRTAFWLLFLPFRLLFAALIIPFWIAKTVLKVVFGVLMFPVMLVVGGVIGVIALMTALVAMLTPLLPLLIVGLLIWVVFRSFRRPVIAA